MTHRITAALTALLLCFYLASCSPVNKAVAPVTTASPAPVTYAENTPSECPATDITHDIQPPGSLSPESSQTTHDPETALSTETAEQSPVPSDTDFVRVLDYIPTAIVDLKYATSDNFTGQVIYSFTDAYLRYGTVRKLMAVQEKLAEQGLCLKILDAFRPVEAQFKLWEAFPDPNYVANPNKGHSSHSKGNAADVTLVYADGSEVNMPTAFDDFSGLADRDYTDADPDAAANALLLETVMLDCGFTAYSNEWWHFTDTTAYPVEESFLPR